MPNSLDATECAVAQFVHQHFANELLQIMLTCKPPSPLRYLLFAPRASPSCVGLKTGDANEHRYPSYFYMKETGHKTVGIPVSFQEVDGASGVTILDQRSWVR